MPECSEKERELLDLIQRSEAFVILESFDDDGPKIYRWMKWVNNPPIHFDIDFDENHEGLRVIRKISVRLGCSPKQWKDALAQAKEAASSG